MHPSQYFGARGEFGEHPNISRRRQLQQQSDARYQALLNSDATGIYSCDANGLITYFNKQAAGLWGREPIMGDAAERFCGSLMLFRLDGRYLPHDQSPMADVLAGKVAGIYDAEVHIQRPDGSRIVVIVNIAPLIDDNGIVTGAFCSFCENPLRKRCK